MVATGRVPVPPSRGVSSLSISKLPCLSDFFFAGKKLLLLLWFGRICKRWAATAGHKTIFEGGTAVLLFLISFPKAPWTTSRSSRVENQVLFLLLLCFYFFVFYHKTSCGQRCAPLPSIAPPSIAYFSPSRDAKASSPFLPSRLEKLIDKQKAERRVEGEETNGVRGFSEASGRRSKHQVFLAEYVLPRIRVVGLLFCFVFFFFVSIHKNQVETIFCCCWDSLLPILFCYAPAVATFFSWRVLGVSALLLEQQRKLWRDRGCVALCCDRVAQGIFLPSPPPTTSCAFYRRCCLCFVLLFRETRQWRALLGRPEKTCLSTNS